MTVVREVTPAELQAEIEAGKDLFVVDMRNSSEFEQWRIEGQRDIPTLNIPYFDIIEDEEAAAARLPKEKELTLVCATGSSSEYVAGLLLQRGFNVRHLIDGGMRGYADLYVPKTLTESPDLTIYQVNRVAKGCVSYVVASHGEAMVVDPGRHFQFYLDFAAENGLTIRHVMDTHIHADHISGGVPLTEATGASYYVSDKDAKGAPYAYVPLVDGQEFPLGTAHVEAVALHSPGHTPGSTCLLINDAYFVTGDTIFVTNVGRPDLGGKAHEWVHDLYDTLYAKLTSLANEVVVLPGHTSSPKEARKDGLLFATMGEIREQVEALNAENKEKFIDMVLGHLPETPEAYGHIVNINKGIEMADDARASELEIGRNLCHAKKEIA